MARHALPLQIISIIGGFFKKLNCYKKSDMGKPLLLTDHNCQNTSQKVCQTDGSFEAVALAIHLPPAASKTIIFPRTKSPHIETSSLFRLRHLFIHKNTQKLKVEHFCGDYWFKSTDFVIIL